MVANRWSDRRSRAGSRWRRLTQTGSVRRPRRPRNSRVTRCRTAVTARLAASTRWKWSTATRACGSRWRTAAAYGADGSIATTSTSSRQAWPRSASHRDTAALVRPSTCPSSPWPPAKSTNPVSHGSTSTHRPSSPCRQRGRPKRVSSIPSRLVGAGSAGNNATAAVTDRCTVGHDTRWLRATSATHRFSPTASAIACRSRTVVRPRGGTTGTVSVNVRRAQSIVRHRHRRLCHNSLSVAGP
jgi:hypothetical protein